MNQDTWQTQAIPVSLLCLKRLTKRNRQ